MANVMKKRERERKSHTSLCLVQYSRTLRMVGDVVRCEHGIIMMATKAVGMRLQVKELDPFRNPILYSRAMRALWEEEQADASPD